jgi:pyridoxal phosphate enzyme (YggS family)
MVEPDTTEPSGTNRDVSSRDEVIAGAVKRLRASLDDLGGSRVRIVGVAKGFPWSDVRAAIASGVGMIGENYAQEIRAKYGAVPVEERPELHFIGRLQSNKIQQLAPLVSVWQTVDRDRLVDELARRLPGARVMIQVNFTGEADKGGCEPGDLESIVDRARRRDLMVVGMMVVGPTSGDRDLTRRTFAEAAQRRADLGLVDLSMGMSGDIDLAVEAGSTMVRVGSMVFGSRPPKD